jgi:hypothetical protein
VAVGGPDVEIRLTQEALRRAEEVAVSTSAFDPADPAAPAAQVLAGTELKNLRNVLVDDPLRSVQSLPGVTASDEFEATFAVRGTGFETVGLYIDGVLMSAPFHTIRDVNDGYSLTLVNGDVVDSITLVAGSAPARYGERTGSVLGLRLREGSREEFFGRASLGATGVYATLEGPLGGSKKTSWLLFARKSYLDYVLDRLDTSGFVLGYYDVTADRRNAAAAACVPGLERQPCDADLRRRWERPPGFAWKPTTWSTAIRRSWPPRTASGTAASARRSPKRRSATCSTAGREAPRSCCSGAAPTGSPAGSPTASAMRAGTRSRALSRSTPISTSATR